MHNVITENELNQDKMNALILCGGKGTRMRPLTFTTPKPLLKLLSLPLLDYLIYKLKYVGCIDKIILAISNDPIMHDIMQYAKEATKRFGIEIVCSKEYQELGTGGPIKNAEELITSDDFLVLNSDIIFIDNLEGLIKEHMKQKNTATLLCTEVEDPRRFGVLKIENRKVLKFIEKPKNNEGNLINAGIYVLNKKIFESIKLCEISLEKEIFPELVNKREVGFYKIKGYWKDVGKPQDFFEAQKYIINNSLNFQIPFLNKNIKETKKGIKYFQHPLSDISEDCEIKDNVSIESGCFIGNGVILENCTIMKGSVIKDGVIIRNSIIGSNCVIKYDSEIEGCLIGDRSKIKGKQVYVIIFPEKYINGDNLDTVII